MNKKNIFLTLVSLAVFVPTIFQTITFYHQHDLMVNETAFRLPVNGYDPRDLTRGRYATLQIQFLPSKIDKACKVEKYHGRAEETTINPACGMCIEANGSKEAKVSLLAASNASCAKFLQPVYPGNRSDPTLPIFSVAEMNTRTFFLDERVADQTDELLRNSDLHFTADVVFAGKNAYFRELYIENTPYRQYIQDHPNTQPMDAEQAAVRSVP